MTDHTQETAMDQPAEFHVTVEQAGDRATDLLHAHSQLTKGRLKHAMQCGAVWLTRGKKTQRLRRQSRPLRAGDVVHLYYDPKVLDTQPIAPTLIEDAGVFSVWDKPSGLRSQGSKWGDHCTVVRWAEKHLDPQRNGFTVHRLDRAASGLIVVAHSKRAAAHLSGQFRDRIVDKRYRATVEGIPDFANDPLIIDSPIDGKAAHTEVAIHSLDPDQQTSVLNVTIKTGRKHQIRRHLAELGYPIVGDRLYGNASGDDVDLQLRAVALAFDHPETGARMEYGLC
ncbi:MAG: RluA family pseudouridine synthase [Pseudomonadota bacterium]